MAAEGILPVSAPRLRLDADGAELAPGAVNAATLLKIEQALQPSATEAPGVRLFGSPQVNVFLSTAGPIGALAANHLGEASQPVRAILFNKTRTTNWALPWHQDRVIAVRERLEVEGFGPWSRKHGELHVAPPPALLARMLTLRLHLDDVGLDNAPLLISPGSHRLGHVPEGEISNVIQRCGVQTCTAARGDVWVYSTPILHASDAAATPRSRRVLQVDYAAEHLPGGLTWVGVA